jgi:uncharacterized protein YdeI (YjbR/CyaY-like superfamily)
MSSLPIAALDRSRAIGFVPSMATKPATPDLPVKSFVTRDELRTWLEANHASHAGLWVRLFKVSSGEPSVTFEDVLDEGLCFGWSESMRRPYDAKSYLQRFTPRRGKGTVSARNKAHVEKLIAEGLMTPAGLRALGIS